MKKTIFFLLAAAFAANTLLAEITVKGKMNNGTGWGNTGKLKEMPKEITVSQFNITFMTTRVSGSKKENARVAVRAELGLSEAVAQSISNQAYAYFKKQMEERGYTVNTHALETLSASKTFQKFSKKNSDAEVSNGGVVPYKNKDMVDEHLVAFAIGVPGANLGKDPGPNYSGYTDLAIELGGKEGKLTASIVGVVDFTKATTEAKTEMNMNIASVGFEPELRVIDIPIYQQPSFNFHSKDAIGGKFWGGHELISDDDSWVKKSVHEDGGPVQYVVNDVAFKKAALEILKAYLDQVMDRIDLAKAGK